MIAAVCCYFNPLNYESRWRNFQKFLHCLDVPCRVIELSFDGTFRIDGSLRYSGGEDNFLWQKERLINLAVEQMPAEIDKIAWVDCDIIFFNKRWLRQTERKLDEFPVCQPFTNFLNTRVGGAITPHRHSFGASYGKPKEEMLHGHPGFAWAARREMFPLYDKAIIGGGDSLLTKAWAGIEKAGLLDTMNPEWKSHWMEWASTRRAKIGVTHGDIIHLHHGSYENRAYMTRWQRLWRHGYDPRTDLVDDENGLLKWAGNKPELQAEVKDYFMSRREDE